MSWQGCILKGAAILFLGLGTWFDLKDREIPVLLFPLFGLPGMICGILWKEQSLQQIFMGACIGGIFLLAGWLTKEAIGYGDGLALTVLGIFEGWKGMLPVIIGAFCLSGIYGLFRMLGLRESKEAAIPFYPFLLISLLGVSLL